MAAASSSGVTLNSYTISTSSEKKKYIVLLGGTLKHSDEYVSMEME
jgi:hypothetical protein